MIVKLFAIFVIGLGAHATDNPCKSVAGRSGQLLRYVIDALSLILAQAIIIDELDGIEGDQKRLLIAGLLAAGGVGSGVGIGHLFDWLYGAIE